VGIPATIFGGEFLHGILFDLAFARTSL